MKKIIILIITVIVTGFYHAQASNMENYIQTRTYLEPVTISNPDAKQFNTVQYFDGLGRPNQVVNVKASPLQKDVITHIEYDHFGRQIFDFLPVPQDNTGNGAISTDPLSNATQQDIYGNERIWSKKILENSPLDRILEQKPVGNAWDSKHVKFQYDANIDGEVKKYIATFNYTNFSSSISLSGNYGTGQLYKNTVIDEDDNKTIEFKNGQGQTILVRKMLDDDIKADTYYVYNDYNQLAYVIPPLASISNTIDDTILNSLCYQYKYDERNRLVEKKLPGKGWEYMVYDKYDRLVLTQDAMLGSVNNNFNKKGWLFTKYDKFGRIVYTGFFANNATRASMQTALNNMNSANIESRSSSPFTLNGMDVHYTKAAFPTGSMTIMSVNYYDTYPPLPSGLAIPVNILNQSILSDNQTSDLNTKGLPVSSYVKNIEDDNWTKNYTWYDTKERAIGSHSINHLGGYTKTESLLDFSGTPKMVITRHKRLDGDNEKVITENFTYDHQNRLLTHTHQIDNNSVEYLTQNKYNELSQLEYKKVGGTVSGNGLQQIDYQYNIRGWMTQINNPADLGGDLFGYKIKYNQVEGELTPNNDFPTLQVKPKYNGNIAEVDWKTSTQENESLKRYGYVYDGLNRLVAGFYQKDSNPTAKEYFEKIDYDLNGNIMRLQRSAELMTGNTAAFKIDNLRYDYTGNKLTKVTEEEIGKNDGYPYLASHNTIEYDNNVTNGNGNMTKHLDKGISSIQYNYLNLPKQVTQNAQLTNYIYRADGAKVKKLFGDIETNYLDGFQYKSTKPSEVGNGGGLGTIGDPNELAVIKLRIIPTSEGYFDALSNQYIYNYTDHLGNIRLSYSDTNKDGIVQPRQYHYSECEPMDPSNPWHFPNCIDYWKPGEIVEVNDYYPFGLMHNYTATSQNPYQYKYNGKELQETGMYDYGARFYMPDIGRWGVVDPLAETNRRFTPYNYAINNPIKFIDPDGRSESDWIRKDGKWQYDAKITTLEQAQHTSGVDGFAKNGTILSNVSVDGATESAYAQLNEGGSITKLGSDEVNLGSDMFSYRTWESQEFQSLLGGANETDPSTASKAIFGDKLTSNDMFYQIFMFYGRNTRLNRGPIGFEEAFTQFGLDIEGIGNPLGGSSESHSGGLSGSSSGAVPIKSSTFSYYGSQAVGLNIYKGSGGITTGVGVKTQDVYKTNMTRAQRDSMINKINADGAKFNNKSDSILRRIQSR